MPKRRRCPHCHHLFIPDPRLKERQITCGRQQCRRSRKHQSNERWRSKHSDYFHSIYPQQKEVYGTRAEYKKQYRWQNPEYVRRNAVFVKKYRRRRNKKAAKDVSSTSCDILVTLCENAS